MPAMSSAFWLASDRVVLGGAADAATGVLDPLRVEPARLLIRDGFIREVHPLERGGDRARQGSGPPMSNWELPTADMGRRLIAPAWVNGHTHLAMNALRGVTGAAARQDNVIEELYFQIESHLTSEDVRAFTRMGAWECLVSGTGAVWDHYYHGRAVADGLADVGLTGVVAPTLQDLHGPGVRWLERQLIETEEIASDAKLHRAGVLAALGPHATDSVSSALWGQVIELSRERGLPVHAHVAQTADEHRRSMQRHGTSSLQRLHREGVLRDANRMLLVHMLFVSDAEVELLSPRRHVVGVCPTSQSIFAFPAEIALFAAAGVPVALGTDCAVSNDSMNVQRELRMPAFMRSLRTAHSHAVQQFRKNTSEENAAAVVDRRRDVLARWPDADDPRILATVWSVPGELHPMLRAGRIGPGQRANLCVWDFDAPGLWPPLDPLRSLCFADPATSLHALLVNGEWKGDAGRVVPSLLQSDLYRAHVEEATGRLEGLLRRAGVGLEPMRAPMP